MARPQPAVPTKQFVFPEYVVCLEDGTRLKTLNRERWSVPESYPKEAFSFTMDRSARAKHNGLDRKPQP